VQAGSHGPDLFAPQAIVLTRTTWVILAGLALALVVSGCGGTSPDSRAAETRIALYGTRTPTPLEAVRTVIAMGTVPALDPEIAAALTAEASLSVATPEPGNVATHMAQHFEGR
jgi:multidrug efflux pump subunit AcrA (membrane-fusion protein)